MPNDDDQVRTPSGTEVPKPQKPDYDTDDPPEDDPSVPHEPPED